MMVPSRPAIFIIILAVSAVWVSGWVASGVGLRVWEEWVGFHYLLHFCFMFLFFLSSISSCIFLYEKCFINKVCLIAQKPLEFRQYRLRPTVGSSAARGRVLAAAGAEFSAV